MSVPYPGPLLTVSKVLSEKARAEFATGETDRAFEDTKTILALAETCAHSPLLLSEAVRRSILHMARKTIDDGLCREIWSEQHLMAFSRHLPQQTLLGQMATTLRGERALALQAIWNDAKLPRQMRAISVNMAQRNWKDSLADAFEDLAWKIRPAGLANHDKALFLLRMQRLIVATGNTDHISPADIISISSSLPEKLDYTNYSRWRSYFSPLTDVVASEAGFASNVACVQTLLESTRAAVAVERFRLANNRLPSSLTDLVPAFLPAVPKDPITGAPLIYKPSPDGSFVIYGVGWNETDDGGSVDSPKIKSPGKQADWGVSVSKKKAE